MKTIDRTFFSTLFYWLPRSLAVFFIIFLSLFAQDVFDRGPLGQALTGFFIHLIPSYLLLLALVLAWKKEKVGGIVFMLLGVVFTLFFRINEIIYFMTISYPVFLIGVLFLLHYYSSENREKRYGY